MLEALREGIFPYVMLVYQFIVRNLISCAKRRAVAVVNHGLKAV